MELQDKFDDITKNLKQYGGYYYPKSSFGTEEIQSLLNYFNIEEVQMTPELMVQSGDKPEKIEWTQEWYYMFSNLKPVVQEPEVPAFVPNQTPTLNNIYPNR